MWDLCSLTRDRTHTSYIGWQGSPPGPDLIAFGFDMRNSQAPLEGILMSQKQEFLGRELSPYDSVSGVLASFPGPPRGPQALAPALQSPLPTPSRGWVFGPPGPCTHSPLASLHGFLPGRCHFSTFKQCQEWLSRLSRATARPAKPEDLFAFAYHAWCLGLTEEDQHTHLCQPGEACGAHSLSPAPPPSCPRALDADRRGAVLQASTYDVDRRPSWRGWALTCRMSGGSRTSTVTTSERAGGRGTQTPSWTQTSSLGG